MPKHNDWDDYTCEHGDYDDRTDITRFNIMLTLQLETITVLEKILQELESLNNKREEST